MNILIFNVENPYIIASYNFYNRHLTSKELLLIENQYFFIFYISLLLYSHSNIRKM